MAETRPQRKYWITFRMFRNSTIIEGDLVAETDKLTAAFFQDIKKGVIQTFIRNNGGVVIPDLTEPTIQACIPLDE